MASTASTINIPTKGGIVNFFVESDPSNPTVNLQSSQSWATANSSGPKIVVSENPNESTRNATITITATTTANSAYNGTASATSSYTINQDCRNLNIVSFPKIRLQVPSYASDLFISYNPTVNVYLSTDGHSRFCRSNFQ